MHGPEFQTAEWFAIASDAGMGIKDRSLRRALHCSSAKKKDGKSQYQDKEAKRYVEQAL